MSDFLLHIYNNNTIKIKVDRDPIIRHLIVEKLKHQFKFIEDYLYIEVDNVDDAINISRIILKVMDIDTSNMSIIFDNINGGRYVEYDDVYYGLVKSTLIVM